MTGFAEDAANAYEAPLTKAAFFAAIRDRQGHFELKDGCLIVQAGGSRNHAIIIGRFVVAFNARLDGERWAAVPTELAVQVGPDIRYPDVVVEALAGDGKAKLAAHPVVLVEVLSESSIRTDLMIKPAEYTGLPSLETYIVASQDEPICWVWQRQENGDFPSIPDEVKGRSAAIALAARGISIPLDEIYRGIGTAS